MTTADATVLVGVPVTVALLVLLVLRDARTVSDRRRSAVLDVAIAALAVAFVAVLVVRFTALV